MLFKKNKEIIEKVKVSIDECVTCGVCGLVCPVEAIDNSDGYPKINQEKCIECRSCEDSCPSEAIKVYG